jgi:hypothetical protein
MMFSKLKSADTIYSVRPINHRWQGRMPHNEPDMTNMKTESEFDGAYCGERYQITLINKLLQKTDIASPHHYHHIELIEIEIQQP